ncbi:MAG: hypothetical protein HQM13_19325 [SAR324 cluster bacterium]|nr:hypothetical protein [SAR324 cluster bacterium]
MKITRIYSGSDGESHFEEIEIPLDVRKNYGALSRIVKVTGIIFRETSEDYNYDFHNAPSRRYIINLEGGVEIEVGDGSKRIFKAGDVFLAEDTTGRGHISRAVNQEKRKSIFVLLD